MKDERLLEESDRELQIAEKICKIVIGRQIIPSPILLPIKRTLTFSRMIPEMMQSKKNVSDEITEITDETEYSLFMVAN